MLVLNACRWSVLAFLFAPVLGSGDPCAELAQLVQATYDFVPAQIPDAQRKPKFAQMDEVWKLVKSDKETYAPCLRKLLEAPDAQAWFRCDGSALLAEAEPSQASRVLEARLWSETSIDIVDLEPWTWTLARLGTQGLDVTRGGESWLRARDKHFYVAKHALTVGPEAAAVIVFGSMEESLATPVLARIAADPAHPGRSDALSVLGLQATPESLAALRKLDLSRFDKAVSAGVRDMLRRPSTRHASSAGPKRAEILAALAGFEQDDGAALFELELHDKEWLAHLSSALHAEDLPLLRRVRRVRLLALSDEALGDYVNYSAILGEKVWTPPGK